MVEPTPTNEQSAFDDSEVAAAVVVADVEMKEDAPEEKPQGQSISGLVNQEYVVQIVDMGFTKVVAEKALFMTQAGVEKAMEWIE